MPAENIKPALCKKNAWKYILGKMPPAPGVSGQEFEYRWPWEIFHIKEMSDLNEI